MYILHEKYLTNWSSHPYNPSTVFSFFCRLPSAILEVAKKMVKQQSGKSISTAAEKEAGWMLIGALVSTMPKQVCREVINLDGIV